MSKTKDNKSKIISFVKTSKPRSTSHKIISQDEFLDGVVVQVEYNENGAAVKKWVIITDVHEGYADSESQLIQQMSTAQNKAKDKFDWKSQIFNISGFIALILVVTSVYLTVTSSDGNIPEHLKASVLTILGFYFGGIVKNKERKKPVA